MDAALAVPRERRGGRGGGPRGGVHKNRVWRPEGARGSNPATGADAARWERGGHVGSGGRSRGRGRGNRTLRNRPHDAQGVNTENAGESAAEMSADEGMYGSADEGSYLSADEGSVGAGEDYEFPPIVEPEFKSQAEKEAFLEELDKWREEDREKAIREGRMTRPGTQIAWSDRIDILGTCPDMCPRYERYRRDKQSYTHKLEHYPGTRTMDHNRAVKMYERGAGDKWQPSDIRPAIVCKRTLDYLFHKVLPSAGHWEAHSFLRDRTRSVRQDLLLQPTHSREMIVECHERVVRYHILSTHILKTKIDVFSESELVIACLSKLRELYAGYASDGDQPYEPIDSPNMLEMYIYWRLWSIREADKTRAQTIRQVPVPDRIKQDPVFQVVERFATAIVRATGEMGKKTALKIDDDAMSVFHELVKVLQEQTNPIVAYLVACTFEREFGQEKVGDFDNLRQGMSLPYIIDGPNANAYDRWEHQNGITDLNKPGGDQYAPSGHTKPAKVENALTMAAPLASDNALSAVAPLASTPTPAPVITPSAAPTSTPAPTPTPASAAPSPFATSISANAFGSAGASAASSPFGAPPPSSAPNAFANLASQPNPFGGKTSAFGPSSAFSKPSNSPFSSSGSSSPSSSSSGKDALGRTTSAFGKTTTSAFATPSEAPPPSQQPEPAPVPKTNGIFSSPLTSSSFAPSKLAQPKGIFSTPLPSAPSQTPPAPVSAPTARSFASSSQPTPSPLGPSLNPQAPTFAPKATPAFAPLQTASANVLPLSQEDETMSIPTPTSTTSQRPPLSRLTTSLSSTPSLETAKSAASIFPKLPYPAPQAGPVAGPFISAPIPKLPSPIAPSPTMVQPSAPRPDILSLPPTPTASEYESPLKTRPLSLFGNASLNSSSASLNDGILSPLNLSGPSIARSSFSAGAGPVASSPLNRGMQQSLSRRRQSVADSPLKNAVARSPVEATSSSSAPAGPAPSFTTTDKGKGKQKALPQSMEDEENALFVSRADALFLTQPFRRWKAKSDYARAVKRSSEYRAQHDSPLAASVSAPVLGARKRLESVNKHRDVVTRNARRVRRRTSGRFVQPRTDEELAARFQENSEQNKRRWEPGTFLRALRKHIGEQPFDWALWLSVNDNDSEEATATWVQKKFDVPESGAWRDANVFSVPINPQAEAASPGLIIFECTPANGVDDIEKRYRALDDYARFKGVVKSLPEDRHFIPALLLVVWDSGVVPDDLNQEILTAVNSGLLRSYAVFSLTASTDDLDERFTRLLDGLNLDTVGGLIEMFSAQELLEEFLAPCKEYAGDCVARLTGEAEGDVSILVQVIQTVVDLLNRVSRHYTAHVDGRRHENALPSFAASVRSTSALYDVVYSWVESVVPRVYSQDYRAEFGASRVAGEDFPVKRFIDQLFDLASARVLSAVSAEDDRIFTVTHHDLSIIRLDVDAEVAQAAERLRRVFAFIPRSKRRSPEEDEERLASEMSRASKKARISFTDEEVRASENGASHVNGMNGQAHTSGALPPPASQTPSPASSFRSIADESRPPVTASMLRALTQNVLKKNKRG